jgi:hypothetical protein
VTAGIEHDDGERQELQLAALDERGVNDRARLREGQAGHGNSVVVKGLLDDSC